MKKILDERRVSPEHFRPPALTSVRTNFETRDFYLACFLRCAGYELVDLRPEGRRKVFVFQDWPTRREDVIAFYGDAATVRPLAFAATIKTDNWFALLYRFAVIPMTLFAGVFFPVESMPLVARSIAYASPLWHGVELCRSATTGVAGSVAPVWHVAYLLAWAGVGFALARWRFGKRLAD